MVVKNERKISESRLGGIQNLADGGRDEIIPNQNWGRKQLRIRRELEGGRGVLGIQNSGEFGSLKHEKYISEFGLGGIQNNLGGGGIRGNISSKQINLKMW